LSAPEPRLGEVIWAEEALRTLDAYRAKLRELSENADRLNASKESAFVVCVHHVLAVSISDLLAGTDVLHEHVRAGDYRHVRWRLRLPFQVMP